MPRLFLIFACWALVTASQTPPAQATVKAASGGIASSNPLLIQIATKCLRLLRRGHQETLINTCGTCKIVGVTRKRSGIAMPVRRSFNIQSGTTYPMPFRGPGSSRITSSQNCQDTVADARDSDKVRIAANRCLDLKPSGKGQGIATLVNNCGSCRAGAVQRMDRNNKILERQAYRIKPNDSALVLSNGAAKVGLIADIACPS